MRAIENTITAYPGQQPEGVLDKRWVYAGNSAQFTLQTADPEIALGITHVISDLLQSKDEEVYLFVSDVVIVVLTAQYTTNFDTVNRALANAAEHYGIEPIHWFSGVPQVAKTPQQPQEV